LDPEIDHKQHLIDLLIHDLRGPLSVIGTSVSNLLTRTKRYGSLTDRQKNTLERALRNTKRAQTLLQEMVEIARSDEGLFRNNQISMESAVQSALIAALEVTDPGPADALLHAPDTKSFMDMLPSYGISVDIRGRYHDSTFCHDQRKIQQILRNLLSNALKHRRRRVAISMSGERDLVFSVEDDGPGIARDDRQAVFDRFVRLPGSEDNDIPGLGLGLAGVKTLVKAMGGQLSLESKHGFGARFIVRIPPLSSSAQQESTMGKSNLNLKRILAVDDEEDVLTVLEEEIIDAYPECHFDKATSYDLAMEMLASWTYDLVILDIMGVRGFELLDYAVSKDFPVVMLTAHALSPEALKRSVECGARAYLPKEKLGEIVPLLEDVLKHDYLPGWKRFFEKLGGFFSARFGPNWQKAEEQFWNEFNERIDSQKCAWWDKGI
jgi:CheY-like chemotaxis protein